MKPRLSPRRSRAFDGREAMADSHQTALQKDTAMKVEKTSIDTLVVGAGQAGVAMSEHLSTLGVPHLVLERDRIAERWHTGRWDSLVANGPAWHDRFPNLEFDDLDLDAFASKEQVADYFVAYAKKFDAPIRTGVEVTKVVRNAGRQGFTIETSDGTIEANRVVVATGPFQRPVIPSIAPKDGNFTQIHSADYRNPEQLPEGAVLVVGAGSSGVQIADELQRAGKQVYLSVGPHDRPPRAYRGRDFCWWLGVLGEWDAEVNRPGKEHVTIAVSGARGGQTVDFRRLAHQGITLVGLTKSFDECMTHPVLELDLAKAGVTSIIWATGYAVDFSWLKVNAFDEEGKPKHQRGVSKEPGVYFLGLPWLSRRGSAFIWGVWHDARHIADHIVTQRKYLAYRDASQRQAQGHSEDGADSASADSRVRKVSEIGVN